MGRMQLENVSQGRHKTPLCLVLYATEGVGKSTFAANAPKPIFLSEPDGTAHLDVHRFPLPQSWQDILDATDVLATEKHEFETFVIDTADWIEPFIHRDVCQTFGDKPVESIESFGYGKGYVAALDRWRVLLARLDRLRYEAGMNVVVLAHSQLRTFQNPVGDDYQRYELQLNQKASALLKAWPNALLFANYLEFARKDEKTKRIRGAGDGRRVIWTEHRPAWDAKTRYPLPGRLALDWTEFEAAARGANSGDADEVLARINGLLEAADEPTKKRTQGAIARAKGDSQKLKQLENWLINKTEGAKQA